MKKNKNLIFTLIITINVFIILGASITYAWFVQFKRSGSIYFKAGEIRYVMDASEVNNTFKANNSIIVPGENLIKENEFLDIKNVSTITSEFRMSIKVTVNGVEYVYTPTLEEINITLCEKQAGETFKWVYNNNYWYYYITDTDTTMPALKEGYVIKMINSIILNGNYFDNTVALKDVKVLIELQGKQKKVGWDDIDWENLGVVSLNG